ncbi:hypothetical protein FB45DRAFT_906385 [Roridomyces roridus]|uniref:DUF7702 domain-containing protein n=1 Tax=Roridomyces roridus TaxID=1738132 RepID=A0AAD7C0Z4_9AGAR|nr:hypothetical protein FB45DRAFT_906385 [Roridomyces roridus]
MSSIDYATLFGYHSVAAAAVFAVVYCVMGAWYVRQSLKNTTRVYIVLTLFCAIRITAFIIRAIESNSVTEGSNLNLFIGDQVLFGVGFFALLFSAFTLVLDRNILAGGPGADGTTLNLLRNSRVFRLLLLLGVILSIVGTTDITSSNPNTVSTGESLHKASTAIFLVLTLVQLAQTIYFFQDTPINASNEGNRWGSRHANVLLLGISLMMLLREGFLTATINDSTRQNNEHLWYPLVAVPEFLAVVCYSVSGLVPTRRAIKEMESQKPGRGQEQYGMMGSRV